MEVDEPHHPTLALEQYSDEEASTEHDQAGTNDEESLDDSKVLEHKADPLGLSPSSQSRSDGEGRRIPIHYRRRRVVEGTVMEGGVKSAYFAQTDISLFALHNDAEVRPLDDFGGARMAVYGVRGEEGRRITFSERRRKRGAESQSLDSSPSEPSNTPQSSPNAAAMDLSTQSNAELGSKREGKSATGQRKVLNEKSRLEPEDVSDSHYAPLEVFEKEPEDNMRQMRARRNHGERRSDRIKASSRNSAISQFGYRRTNEWPSHTIFPDNTSIMDCENEALAVMAGLENRLNEMIEKKAFSEDLLQWLRAEVAMIDGLLRDRREVLVSEVERVKGGAKVALQQLRMQMVSLMTDTTQFTFEALEDVRSSLITQILADEEQVQWELEKMDVQIGEIAKPLAVLHHLTSQLGHMAPVAMSGLQQPMGMTENAINSVSNPSAPHGTPISAISLNQLQDINTSGLNATVQPSSTTHTPPNAMMNSLAALASFVTPQQSDGLVSPTPQLSAGGNLFPANSPSGIPSRITPLGTAASASLSSSSSTTSASSSTGEASIAALLATGVGKTQEEGTKSNASLPPSIPFHHQLAPL